MEQNIGNQIEVKLFKKDERGNKEYIGTLNDFDEDTITIKIDDEIYKFNKSEISHMKTVYNW